MKQITLFRAVATAGLLMIFAASMSAGTPIRLSFRDTTIVGGNPLLYPLSVDSSLTGYSVSAFEIQFSYNTTGFSFTGATVNGCIDSMWGTPMVNEVSPGVVKISSAGSVDLIGKGKLVVLQFDSKILSNDSYFSFTIQSSVFNQGIPTSNNYKNGSVLLKAPPKITISPDTWLATKGETKQFFVSGGKAPYTWGSTVPSVASINASGLLTTIGAGLTRVIVTDSAGIVDTSNIVEVRPFKLNFRDTSRYQGQMLDLPVYSTDLAGLGITAGQFTVTYDNAKWSVDSVIQTGTLLESLSPVTFHVSQGGVSVSFTGSPSSGSGILLYLRLKASSVNSGGTTFAFQNVVFNEYLFANVGSAYINVLSLPTISVNPNFQQNLVVGDSLQFTASGGTNPYTWTVTNPLFATVSSTGLLKAQKNGTIVVKAQDVVGSVGSSGNVNLYDFKFSIPDTALIATSFVEVPIYVTPNAPGFSSFEITFSYSTNTFVKLVDFVRTGTLSNGFTADAIYGNGTAKIVAASVSAVTSGGIIFKLKFAVPDSTPKPSTTNITVTSIKFNEGTPLALTKNGSFQIANRSIFSSTPAAVSLHASVGKKDSALITVFNTGTANLTSTIGVVGPAIYTTSPTNLNVIPGDSAKVKVYFQPLTQGITNATIRFSTNDPFHSTVDVAVTGTTPYPIIGISSASFNFGMVSVGQFKDTVITISNSGTDTLKITGISSTVLSFTARPIIGKIPPGQSMMDTLRFTPTVSGYAAGRISITSNSLTSPDTIGVSGTGNSFFPVLVLSAKNVVFGPVKVGEFKDTTVTISNSGTDTLKITNITASNGSFTGRPTNWKIPPGQSLTDTLRFTPASVGVFTGRIFIANNSPKNPDTIIVSGTGTSSNGISKGSEMPSSFVLEQNYPNPFNPSTMLRFGLPERSAVRLLVYNTIGQLVEQIFNGTRDEGYYEFSFDASGLSSGIYLFKIEAVSQQNASKVFVMTKKMVLTR